MCYLNHFGIATQK